MVAPSFLSTLFFALGVAAHTVERKASLSKLRFTKRVSASLYNIANLDRLRVNAIKGFNNFEVINSSAENAGTTYIASVGVGQPPTTCKWLQQFETDYKFLKGSCITDDLQVDTGRWAGRVRLLTDGSNDSSQLEHMAWSW